MKYDLFIRTLERGRDIGLGTKFNISDILQEEFKKPVSNDPNNWNPEVEIQFDVLRDMQYKLNIIKFDSMETSRVHWDIGASKPIWFDETPFEVWVTVGGLDYLNQYYLRQSYFNLNGTLVTNTKKQTTILGGQRKYLYLTAFFTACTLGISIFNYFSDKSKEQLQKQIQLQTTQIHTLQIELSQTMNLQSEGLRVKKISAKKN